jgi:hypothetical protein
MTGKFRRCQLPVGGLHGWKLGDLWGPLDKGLRMGSRGRKPGQLPVASAAAWDSPREALFSPLSCQILTPPQEKEAPFVRCCGHFLFSRLQPIFRFAECGGRRQLLDCKCVDLGLALVRSRTPSSSQEPGGLSLNP